MVLAGGAEFVAAHPLDDCAHADLLGAGQGGAEFGLGGLLRITTTDRADATA